MSETTVTRSAIGSSLSLPHHFATAPRARSAELSERAHSSTSPCCAAVAAKPHAIAPDPAIPSRSSTECSLS